ncbi:DUF1513 domain-containing protein [Allohahella marinimesophila]|uniref:DUF1513 domain-containing protein n=1 Tax=Allohahella marinimesophila TaxID=1054972 RepID=A0ABP7PCL7_9GAMM
MTIPARHSRRRFLGSVAASSVASACIPAFLLHRSAVAAPVDVERSATESSADLASAFMEADSNPPRYRLTLGGRPSEALPGRAHGIAINADRSMIVSFARRPERWMQVYRRNHAGDYVLSHELNTPEDRHGMGHGVFSADGARLYTTENDFGQSRGVIGVYDSVSFRRVGEIDSGGVGPHEIVLLPASASTRPANSDIVCVANGGLETDPDFPRMILNEGQVESSLAFIEITGRNGYTSASLDSRVLGRHRLPESGSSLSIRHLAAVDSATVCFGCQDQDQSSTSEFSDRLVGVATFRPDQAAAMQMLAPVPDASGYIGSVAYDVQSKTVLTSAPRGNTVAMWRIDKPHEAPILHSINDACGACVPAAQPGHFLVSTGFGELWLLPANGSRPELIVSAARRHYDNHMTMI